jgi:hypothetical protein
VLRFSKTYNSRKQNLVNRRVKSADWKNRLTRANWTGYGPKVPKDGFLRTRYRNRNHLRSRDGRKYLSIVRDHYYGLLDGLGTPIPSCRELSSMIYHTRLVLNRSPCGCTIVLCKEVLLLYRILLDLKGRKPNRTWYTMFYGTSPSQTCYRRSPHKL